MERSPEEAIREHTKIYGVGVWTTQLSVAMVSEKLTIGPISDLAVRRGLRRVFKEEKDYREILEIIRNLGNYIGLIMYLASYSYEVSK